MTEGTEKYEVPVPEDVKRVLQGLADGISTELPPGWGFALFLVEYGDQGTLAYISSADREGMVPAIDGWVRRQKEG